jgi:DNA polymerase elongation subunit (family B)
MDAGYLFPVLKKPDDKLPSYEGAIVFDPEANVEYEALAVKDYASLYPSSIIHKNMSHETIIKLDKYDNDDLGRTLHDIKEDTDYCLDEVTMKVYKKASVQLQMKNGDWITYGYYSTNEEAATVAKEIARKSPETFV